jgi:hypothetical protein
MRQHGAKASARALERPKYTPRVVLLARRERGIRGYGDKGMKR